MNAEKTLPRTNLSIVASVLIMIVVVGAIAFVSYGLGAGNTSSRSSTTISSAGSSNSSNNRTSVAVNPVTHMVYVLEQRTYAAGGVLSVVNGLSDEIVATIGVGHGTFGVDVNTVTNTIYVANSGENTVSVIDGSSNRVVSNISGVGGGPNGVAVDPHTNMIYVTGLYSRSLTAINGSTGSVVDSLSLGDNPLGVAVNPNTSTIYVPLVTASVLKISEVNNSISGRILFNESLAGGIAVDSKTNRVYVGGVNSVFSLDALGKPTKIAPANYATGISSDSEARKVYSTNFYSGNVSSIDLSSGNVVTINTPAEPASVGIDPSSGLVFVSGEKMSVLSVLNVSTNHLIRQVQLGAG